MKFRVWCLSWDDTEENGTDIETGKIGEYKSPSHSRIVDWRATTASSVAEIYADFCHNQRDGWEATWPLKFRVRSEDGSVQDFEIDREMAPVFNARAVTKEGK